MLPKELNTITRGNVKSPFAMRNPAKGMTNSDGTGTTILSSIIRKNIPAYPKDDITDNAKVPIAAIISDKMDMTLKRNYAIYQ
jgi:hypothetical protein